MKLKALLALPMFILLWTCCNRSGDTDGSNSLFIKNDTTKTEYSFTDTLKADTLIAFEDDTYLLELVTYSLNDNSLKYLRSDTIGDTIHNSLGYFHDAYWIMKLHKNGERSFTKFMKKFDTGVPLDNYAFVSCEPHLPELKYFNPKVDKMVFHLWMGVPDTDWLEDYFIVMSIEEGDMILTQEHGSSYCISGLQVLNNRYLLTCTGLYDLEKRKRITGDRPYIIAAEKIDDRSFLIMYDHVVSMQYGFGRLYEYKVDSTDNCFVFNTKGDILYSFDYKDYWETLSYTAAVVKSQTLGRIMILDMTNKQILLPGPNKLEKIPLVEAPSTLPDSTESLMTWLAEEQYTLFVTPEEDIFYRKTEN